MLDLIDQPPGKVLEFFLVVFVVKRLSLGQSSAEYGRIGFSEFYYVRNVGFRVFINSV